MAYTGLLLPNGSWSEDKGMLLPPLLLAYVGRLGDILLGGKSKG